MKEGEIMTWKKSKSKYKNKPIIIDGRWFASQREGRRYEELRLLERAGEISRLKTQVAFPITINGEKICTYRADFTYRTKEGKTIVEDTKGFLTPIYKIKKKLLWVVCRINITET